MIQLRAPLNLIMRKEKIYNYKKWNKIDEITNKLTHY